MPVNRPNLQISLHQRLPSVVHVRMGPGVQFAFEQDCVAPVRLQSRGPHGDRVDLIQESSRAAAHDLCPPRVRDAISRSSVCAQCFPRAYPSRCAVAPGGSPSSLQSLGARTLARRRPNHWRSVARCLPWPEYASMRARRATFSPLVCSCRVISKGNHLSHRVAAEEVRAGRLHLANFPHGAWPCFDARQGLLPAVHPDRLMA